MLLEVAHPGALGFFCLALAVLATLVGGFFLFGAVTTITQGVRGKGWSWGLDGGATVMGIAAIFASIGLWYLTIRYLPDLGRLVIVIGRVLLVSLLVLGAAGAGLAGAAHVAEKKRVLGAGLFFLALLFATGVVVYFAGFDSLESVPRFFARAGTAASRIPLGIWAGTVAAAFLLGVVLRGGLGMLVGGIAAGGGETDTAHRWTDHRGIAWGKATRSEVYDHYHGRGSWDAMVRGFSLGTSLAAFALPVLGPLAVVHWAGWFRAWSEPGVVLAVALGITSLGATALLARLRR
jgi:hypothetical protein